MIEQPTNYRQGTEKLPLPGPEGLVRAAMDRVALDLISPDTVVASAAREWMECDLEDWALYFKLPPDRVRDYIVEKRRGLLSG